MYSHCANGGWILGNRIDGTQAEYVRIPFADTSLYHAPDGISEALITGGLPGLSATADEVYRLTYQKVAANCRRRGMISVTIV